MPRMETTTPTQASNVLTGTTDVSPPERVHIVSTPDTCGGKPRIAGSRIQVKHVVVLHELQSMSPEEIVAEFPHLTLADVYAALAYYHDNREAMNAEIAADRAWYGEQVAKQPLSRLREILESRKSHAPDDPLPQGRMGGSNSSKK